MSKSQCIFSCSILWDSHTKTMTPHLELAYRGADVGMGGAMEGLKSSFLVGLWVPPLFLEISAILAPDLYLDSSYNISNITKITNKKLDMEECSCV